MSKAALRKLRKQLEEIRDSAGEDTSVGQALVLVTVALRGEVTVGELADELNTSHSMASRAADILGDHQGRLKAREPAGLLERRYLPSLDRKARFVVLTRKGQELAKRLGAS